MPSVLGGGGGKSSQTTMGGFSALPPQLRAVFGDIGSSIGQYTNPNNPGVIDRFTPMAQTADETAAIDRIRQGFAPTADSIKADIAMQQNPFDQYVIQGINREATGANSILNQALSRAGQVGSNRGMLGANDIDLSRLQQIGQFQQSQFNNALNNALTTLPSARASDAAGLMGIGDFLRNLDLQTKQAPISALQAGTGMMAPFVSGNQQGTETKKEGGSGMLGGFGNLLSGASALGKAYSVGQLFGFSDVNLKQNIAKIGNHKGINIYQFEYIPEMNMPGKFVGVLAQEILETDPDAVINTDIGLVVNYSKIGVDFREVHHG